MNAKHGLTLVGPGEVARPLNGESVSTFENAVTYAKGLYAAQTRTGTNMAYLMRLIGTAAIAKAHAANETERIAALLHRAVEDHPRAGRTAGEIREYFGKEVLSIVMVCTDTVTNPKPPWKERKVAYIARLGAAAPSVLLVSASDTLYNARSIVEDFKKVGPAVFKRFAPSQQGTAWYYRELVRAFRDAGGPKALVDELDALVTEMESAKPQGTSVPSPETTYTVEVDDNYHYMNESERYTLGEYDTWEEALAAAKKVVDDFLDASSEVRAPRSSTTTI